MTKRDGLPILDCPRTCSEDPPTIFRGTVLEGMIVSSFHATKEQWAGRKDLSFSMLFKFHPDLVLVPTAPVTEQ